MFRKLFHRLCLKIDPFLTGPKITTQHPTTRFTTALESKFCEFANQLMIKDVDDESFYSGILSSFKESWHQIHSTTTCFTCLARRPENTLECDHALCTPCTMVYGECSEANPWDFFVKTCPLCGETNTLVFSQKPATAGVRIVCVEGGGIRGIIPLTFLKLLEKSIGLPLDIREHFDIAFGSSSGNLHPPPSLFDLHGLIRSRGFDHSGALY